MITPETQTAWEIAYEFISDNMISSNYAKESEIKLPSEITSERL